MDETSTVIVPKGIDLADLKTEMTKKDDDTGTLTYRYHGWPVGKGKREISGGPPDRGADSRPDAV